MRGSGRMPRLLRAGQSRAGPGLSGDRQPGPCLLCRRDERPPEHPLLRPHQPPARHEAGAQRYRVSGTAPSMWTPAPAPLVWMLQTLAPPRGAALTSRPPPACPQVSHSLRPPGPRGQQLREQPQEQAGLLQPGDARGDAALSQPEGVTHECQGRGQLAARPGGGPHEGGGRLQAGSLF